MLCLKREEHDWIIIKHKSGDTILICTKNIKQYPNTVDLVFDDKPRNFEITRPERLIKR